MPFNFPLAPPQASSLAPEYDYVFYALLALTIFFTGIVVLGVIVFSIRYRRGTKADRSRPIYEDLRLELTWTIVPLVLGLIMFGAGARVFVDLRTPPKDCMEIFVIGKQWMWHFEHPSGVRENNTLHVPLGRDVKLVCISQDVLHAMFIPAFRQQIHVVPGRYTDMWFKATKLGEYHMFCNMYCGTQHSEMGGTVVVMKPEDYSQWVANNGLFVAHMTVEQAGERLFDTKGCSNCHGNTDTLRAPSLIGIYNKRRVFSDGTSMIADEDYLRESILNPYNHITAGYGQSMPAYKNQLTEEEVLNLVGYIKSLGAGGHPLPASLTSNKDIPVESAKTNGQNPLAVGAIQYRAGNYDSSPTIRHGAPSEGAIAARGTNP